MMPIEKKDYHHLIKPLKQVPFNHLFARSVVEGHISGTVYVDDKDHPCAYYIIHPYCMSLLLGDSCNASFNEAFLKYALSKNSKSYRDQWLQVSPGAWNTLLNDYVFDPGDSRESPCNKGIELHTRVNFRFNPDKYRDFKKCNRNAIAFRADRKVFHEMTGSVVPAHFWDNADDFCKHGVGFSVYENNTLASTAFSAFIHGDQLELGIETRVDLQGRGYARLVCSVLIDHCLEHNFVPVWSCRLGNTASYKLALRLGFEPTVKLPYYKLIVQ